jgi:trehalose 6-phosphate synthase
MVWSKDRLVDVARTRLGGARLIVVANREPYIHRHKGGEGRVDPPGRRADRRARPGDAGVPPDDPSYTLRRVWLTKDDEEGYYYGFANGTLWPLCHQVFARPAFDPRHWARYRAVNETFAAAVLEQARGGPALVFVRGQTGPSRSTNSSSGGARRPGGSRLTRGRGAA